MVIFQHFFLEEEKLFGQKYSLKDLLEIRNFILTQIEEASELKDSSKKKNHGLLVKKYGTAGKYTFALQLFEKLTKDLREIEEQIIALGGQKELKKSASLDFPPLVKRRSTSTHESLKNIDFINPGSIDSSKQGTQENKIEISPTSTSKFHPHYVVALKSQTLETSAAPSDEYPLLQFEKDDLIYIQKVKNENWLVGKRNDQVGFVLKSVVESVLRSSSDIKEQEEEEEKEGRPTKVLFSLTVNEKKVEPRQISNEEEDKKETGEEEQQSEEESDEEEEEQPADIETQLKIEKEKVRIANEKMSNLVSTIEAYKNLMEDKKSKLEHQMEELKKENEKLKLSYEQTLQKQMEELKAQYEKKLKEMQKKNAENLLLLMDELTAVEEVNTNLNRQLEKQREKHKSVTQQLQISSKILAMMGGEGEDEEEEI